MLTLKRIALVVLSAGSMSAFALPPTVIAPTWHIGAAALYLQPNFGGNGLGYSAFSNYGTDSVNRTVELNGATNNLKTVDPNREWGFKVDAGYDFTRTNDLDLNWSHFNNTTSGHFSTGTLFAGSASALYAGQFQVRTQWDAINLVVGQRFDLNACNELHVYAGLDYSRIQVRFTNYPQINPTGAPLFITYDTITYTGVGPHVGGDYTYYSPYGIDFYAKGAGSLLVGTAKQSVTGYHDLAGFNLYSTGNYNQNNHDVVVPEFEADLGLKYERPFSLGRVGIDAGYMFVTYLGGLVSQVGAGVVSSSISTSSSTNFNLNGPYIAVTWAGLLC